MSTDPTISASASPQRVLRRASAKLVELYYARELLTQLVSKELKVRYKSSTLGFLWSMITPVLTTIVFSVVFTYVVEIPVDNFPAFFISGYLLWQFFQNSCQGAIHSVVGNGDLVKKVYFPREVLPLSHVLAQFVHLVLALLVVSPYLIYTRGWGVLVYLPATLIAMVLVGVFASGVAMWFAGVNVVFRDLQELFIVIFQVWFYATPILYPLALVSEGIRGGSPAPEWLVTVLHLNPMTWFVEVFRAPLYGTVVEGGDPVASITPGLPGLVALGVCVVLAMASLTFGYVVFSRRAKTFAKEV